jgi:hypothetical protein
LREMVEHERAHREDERTQREEQDEARKHPRP